MTDPRLIERLALVVQHLLQEHRAGAPLEHVLWEAAVASAYVGMGWHPVDALRRAEALEHTDGFPTASQERRWMERFEQERLRTTGRYPTQEMA